MNPTKKKSRGSPTKRRSSRTAAPETTQALPAAPPPATDDPVSTPDVRFPSGVDARPEVILYTDGACSGNPGPGGWGAVLVSPKSGRRLEISGAEAQTTNNRMELTGVIEGLRRLKRPSRVRVVTDSRYIVDGMKGWIHTWQRNGWRTADKKPVKNRELWEELIQFTHRHDLRFEWIRGHAGHRENERCDRMAVEAYENLLRLRKGPDRRA